MSQNIIESDAGPWTTTIDVPTDVTDRITADADLAGDGPVNPAFQALLDRDAQMVLGTATFYAITVDGIGEQPVVPTAGLISTTGNILALGSIQAGQQVEAGTEHFVGTAAGKTHMDQRGFIWDDITALDANGPNPPRTTPIPNQIRAINTPKAWAVLRTMDGGYPGYYVDGAGFAAAQIKVVAGPVSTITFTMAQPMASTFYIVFPFIMNYATRAFVNWSAINRKSTTQFELVCEVNPHFEAVNYEVMVLVYGRQNT